MYVLLDQQHGNAALIDLANDEFSFTNRGERPSDGSSISSSLGAHISPRPIDTIACSPPDIVPAS